MKKSGTDKIYNCENLIGTQFSDYIVGNNSNNWIQTGNGSDYVIPWYGVKVINGGTGVIMGL